MGQTNGLTGGVTGKIGSMVFYYRNGKYVAREYIRHPNNPKSELQRVQRLKMALAGRISGVVPYAAIEGFSGSRTDRRSRFMSNLILSSTVNGMQASVRYEDVVFSEGSLALLTGHQVTAGTSGTYDRRVIIQCSHGPTYPELPEGYGERYVVLLLNNGTSQFDYCVTGLLSIPEGDSPVDTPVNVRVGERSVPYTAIVYVYPFVGTTGADGRFRVSYLGTDEGTVVVDAVTGETLGRPVLFGRSEELRAVVLNPPSQQSVSAGVTEGGAGEAADARKRR